MKLSFNDRNEKLKIDKVADKEKKIIGRYLRLSCSAGEMAPFAGGAGPLF